MTAWKAANHSDNLKIKSKNELFQYSVTLFSFTGPVLLRCHTSPHESVNFWGPFLQRAACAASVFIQCESQSHQLHCAWPGFIARSLSHALHPSTGTSCLCWFASHCCFLFICHCVQSEAHWMPLIAFIKVALTESLFSAECSSNDGHWKFGWHGAAESHAWVTLCWADTTFLHYKKAAAAFSSGHFCPTSLPREGSLYPRPLPLHFFSRPLGPACHSRYPSNTSSSVSVS